MKTAQLLQCYVYYKIKIDIKFRVHGTFLEQPSSGTLKIEKLEKKNNLKFWEQ